MMRPKQIQLVNTTDQPVTLAARMHLAFITRHWPMWCCPSRLTLPSSPTRYIRELTDRRFLDTLSQDY